MSKADSSPSENDLLISVFVSREDSPHDVDEAYGDGTYARLFPNADEGDE